LRTETRRGRGRSPAIAAVLSFIWPGLGQWYAGARAAAVVFALPVLIAVLVPLTWLLRGPESFVFQLLSPGTALTIVVLIALLGVWRFVAMIEGVSATGGRAAYRQPKLAAGLAVMTGAILVSHLAVGSLAWSFYSASSKIFTTEPDSNVAGASESPAEVGGLPVATPIATPATADSRINILFLGIDSSERRTHALTDTLMVVSVDPTAKTAAMISFPRDIAGFTMYSGGTYAGKINALLSDAEHHRNRYPDGGLTTLTKEVGFLLGIPIHYYAAINLDGFEAMIDRVGGVTINNPTAINDPSYGGWHQPGRIGFQLSKGTHSLDGPTALAYVRSRKGPGGNDFERARRQQQVLVALERKLSDPAMLPKIPGLLEDATRTITTSFPPDRLGEMLDLSQSIDDTNITRKVLGPPYALRDPKSGDYRLIIVQAKLTALSIELFGPDSRYATTGATQP
jgi:LCP family protein required for cell wall assembly